MDTVSAVFEKGVIKPLRNMEMREKEKILLAVIKLPEKTIMKKTYGAVKIKNHKEIERIIEDTEYGNW